MKKKNIKNWITWHRWPMPKDIIILSFYEFVAYLIILLLFILAFYLIQRVPVHEDTITAYQIQRAERDSNKTNELLIKYVIPMTIFYNKNNGHGNFVVKDTLVKQDSLINEFFSKPSGWESDMDIIRTQLNDSFMVFQDRSLFHIKIDFDISYNEMVLFFKNKDWKRNIYGNSLFEMKKTFMERRHIISDNYFTDHCIIKIKDTKGPGPISRPGIFSLYDISQSYFNFNLHGNFQKSKVIINFGGATEFSKMTPEPDEISMNYIAFEKKEKIDKIRMNGLKFHAKFIELENLQSSRVFVISAILSAMIALFLTFIVLSIYKMKIHLRKKKVEAQSQSETKEIISQESQLDNISAEDKDLKE